MVVQVCRYYLKTSIIEPGVEVEGAWCSRLWYKNSEVWTYSLPAKPWTSGEVWFWVLAKPWIGPWVHFGKVQNQTVAALVSRNKNELAGIKTSQQALNKWVGMKQVSGHENNLPDMKTNRQVPKWVGRACGREWMQMGENVNDEEWTCTSENKHINENECKWPTYTMKNKTSTNKWEWTCVSHSMISAKISAYKHTYPPITLLYGY